MRTLRFGGLLAIACTALFARVSGQATFRATTDLIELNVAVTRGGRPVSGLGPVDFEVTDNGRIQQVVSVSSDTLPIDLTLVVDTSGSIDQPLAQAIDRAMSKVHDRLRADDRLAIVRSIKELPRHCRSVLRER